MKGKIQNWIKTKVEESNTTGVVVGISGGIDSSITAILCNNVVDTLALIMPCESNKTDKEDALLLVNKFKIPYYMIQLDDVYSAFLNIPVIKACNLSTFQTMQNANLKSRLRMCTLYYFANYQNRLVAGTSNKTEIAMGYYTKYGDGGVDIEPIGDLYKIEVHELAKKLNIPQNIINKPPSAGLWEGQTDEGELGISYEELDNILKRGENTKHKRRMAEVCRI